MRGHPELAAWGERRSRRRAAVFVGSDHIRGVLEEVVGHVERVHEVPPGVDVDEWRPRPRAEALGRPARRGTPRPAEPRQRERAAPGRGQRRAARASSSHGDEPTGRLLRQAPLQQGRPRPARGAAGRRRARRDRRLRRLPRRARAPRRPDGRSSPARSSTATSSTCCRWRTRPSCRRSSPRRSGWSPPRLPPPARRRSSPATRASPRSPRGSRRSTRRSSATSRRSRPATSAELAAKLSELLALPAADRAALSEAARRADARALELGGRRAAPARTVHHTLRRMADARCRRAPARGPRALRRRRTDFTVAVEEEFALLDPEHARPRQPLRGGPGGRAGHRARAATSSAS